MPLTDEFALAKRNQSYQSRPRAPRKKREAPFSIRLSQDERARLAMEAAGVPLGAYIKAKALSGTPPRRRCAHHNIKDTKALAQILALLGASRIANNLNQLAFAVNTGSLPVTPETETELMEALTGVRQMRDLLLRALGLRTSGS